MTQLPTATRSSTRTYCTSIYETNFLSESPIIPIIRILARRASTVLRGAAASNKPAMAPLVAVRNFVLCFTRWPQPPPRRRTTTNATRRRRRVGRGERERRERGSADRETERRECTIQFERRPCSARSSPLSSFGLRIFESARHFFFRTPPEARPTDHDREAYHHDHVRPARKCKPN